MYGKIFSEIFDSSISEYGGITMYVFMSMIALSDAGGFVRFTTKTLADRIKLPLDSVLEAVGHLEAPDPESSNPEYEGRRIIPLKEATGGEECRGWWIVSHEKWKEIASREDRRLKTRERVRRLREKKALVTQGNAVKRPVTQCTKSTPLELESEVELEVEGEDKILAVAFSRETKLWSGINEERRKRWKETYPGCDLDVELLKMREWLLADWGHRKKIRWEAFVVNWLARAQGQGGTRRAEVKGAAPGTWLESQRKQKEKEAQK